MNEYGDQCRHNPETVLIADLLESAPSMMGYMLGYITIEQWLSHSAPQYKDRSGRYMDNTCRKYDDPIRRTLV
ncbi:putative lipoprotein [Salmonella phage 21]|nr:putative lipoprotein [Salmonella phage 21]